MSIKLWKFIWILSFAIAVMFKDSQIINLMFVLKTNKVESTIELMKKLTKNNCCNICIEFDIERITLMNFRHRLVTRYLMHP